METEYDMTKICRCCRKKGPRLQSIFKNAAKTDTSLLTMLGNCFQIQVSENDGLPTQLCAKCIGCVNSAYDFRNRYMESDSFLREYLSQRSPDDEDQDALLCTMSVKVELTDIKAEQVFLESTPSQDEGEFESPLVEPDFRKRSKSKDVKPELVDLDENIPDGGRKSDDDSDYVAEFGGGDGPSSDEWSEGNKKDATNVEVAGSKRKRKPASQRKECPVCSRTFGSTYHLKRHIKAHKNDTNCEFCGKNFSAMSYADYRQHMVNEHPGMPLQPHRKPETSTTGEDKSSKADKLTGKNVDSDYVADEDAAGSGDDDQEDGSEGKSTKRKRHKGEHRKCPLCDRGFPSKYHLERHVRAHKNDTQCEYCEEKFAAMDYKDYRQHMLDEHPGLPVQPHRKSKPDDNTTLVEDFFKDIQKKQVICKICDTAFTRIADLRNHLKSHVDPSTLANVDIPTKPYLFQEGYVLENYLEHLVQQICKWDVLRFYQIVEPDGEELELSDSDSEPDEETSASVENVRRVHTCSICNQSFPRLRYIMDHVKEHHQSEQLLRCRHCKQGFPNNALLERHLKQQCENNNKKFLCAFCNKKFMWQTSLNKHAQSKHAAPNDSSDIPQDSGKRFLCQVCNKGFAQMHHLKRHARGHVPSEKKFECPECHRKFHRKDNLNFHMKTHLPVRDQPPKRTHLCSLCGRGFTSNYNYIVHMRRHTGERPFKCDMCDKAFPRSLDLTYHRRTHTGDKPNVCTICGKAFSRHHRLVRHMRVHTGVRPYSCTYCDRTFTQSNDLTLHIRRHTGEKPYSCPICNERFIQGTALRTHQRSAGHFTEDTLQPVGNYGRSLLEVSVDDN